MVSIFGKYTNQNDYIMFLIHYIYGSYKYLTSKIYTMKYHIYSPSSHPEILKIHDYEFYKERRLFQT